MRTNTILSVIALLTLALISCNQNNQDENSVAIEDTSKEEVIKKEISVPDFTLPDQLGNNVTLSDYSDKIVVLEWINPDCPYVQRHYKEETMAKLAKKYSESEIVWLAINSTHYMEIENNKEWAETYDLSYQILDDNAGYTGRAYEAKTTPQMYIIDKGDLVYKGAIDDDKFGRKLVNERTNYIANALMEISTGNQVQVAETKPYGCSVKYKN